MNTTIIVFLAGCLLLAPSVRAAETGSITGVVDQPGKVRAVAAINRHSGHRYAGRLERETGRFLIDLLPLEAEYDCQVDFVGGRWEGVDLKVPRSEYEVEQPLSRQDQATITAKTRAMNQFENVVDILAVTGNVQHAAVLVNKLKTDGFSGARPGEIIWRAELWHFERPDETWVKVQDELWVVLYRERLSRDAYARQSITFDPALGGLRLTAKQPRLDLDRLRLPPATPGVRVRTGVTE